MSAVEDKEGTTNMTRDAVPESASMGPYASQPRIELVAVVIPARNRADLLEKCLDSLACQTLPEGVSEILVCDDGSSEDLAALIRTFRSRFPGIRLIKQPPKGPAAARNMGFRSSHADIFVCVDSDVICADGFILNLVEALRRSPDWVAAEARIEPQGGRESPLWDAPICENGGRYHTAAIAYRRSAVLEAGGFDETFPLAACEDVEFATRLMDRGTIGFVPQALVFHPRRQVRLSTHWAWRKHWKYTMILAKRSGCLAFPGYPAGSLPRLRVALAAVVTLPAGRLLEALKYAGHNPGEGLCACTAALFDVICGLAALPEILFSPVRERKNYLRVEKSRV